VRSRARARRDRHFFSLRTSIALLPCFRQAHCVPAFVSRLVASYELSLLALGSRQIFPSFGSRGESARTLIVNHDRDFNDNDFNKGFARAPEE